MQAHKEYVFAAIQIHTAIKNGIDSESLEQLFIEEAQL